MKATDLFSRDYEEARGKFLEAGRRASAKMSSVRHPLTGPGGGGLFVDTAWCGPDDAANVLVAISATHGVEGFCGSAMQAGWMANGFLDKMPEDTAYLAIHAINPHGFAWLRRVTEDNVDLNRNFVDHDGRPYPENPGYRELAEALCPREWNDAVIAESHKVLAAYAEAHGMEALRNAISGGQFLHPAGIFFGGHGRTWSHRQLKELLAEHLASASRVAVIDFHTGLGPRGHGERICPQGPASPAFERLRSWFDGDVTSPTLKTSASVEITGSNVLGIEEALPHAELSCIALEFGTRPPEEVQLALRADNWLHMHGDLKEKKATAIKDQIRDAFYQDAPDWKEGVWERSIETQRAVLKGLGGL